MLDSTTIWRRRVFFYELFLGLHNILNNIPWERCVNEKKQLKKEELVQCKLSNGSQIQTLQLHKEKEQDGKPFHPHPPRYKSGC